MRQVLASALHSLRREAARLPRQARRRVTDDLRRDPYLVYILLAALALAVFWVWHRLPNFATRDERWRVVDPVETFAAVYDDPSIGSFQEGLTTWRSYGAAMYLSALALFPVAIAAAIHGELDAFAAMGSHTGVGYWEHWQRTPAWIIPRDTRAYPAIEKRIFRRLPLLRKLHRARLYWTNESRVWPVFHPSLAKGLQQLTKLFIRHQVNDKETARKLTPSYTMGCKRILISNDYYPAFNRDNVELHTSGIAEIRENSVVTKDGQELPADCIILGTGFVVDPRQYMRGFEVTGVNGHRLQDDWADASRAYMGITVPNYPNFYLLVGPNTGLGHNSIIFMIECQVHYIMECLKLLRQKNADYIDTRQQALDEFDEEVQNNIEGTVWTSGCQSWYQQEDGRNVALWPFSTWKYWLRTRRVDTSKHRFVQCPATVNAEAENA